MSLLQEKSGEREKKRASEKRDSAGIPRALRLAGAGSWLGRRKRRLAQIAGAQTNKIKEAAKDSADASEKSSGERSGKHSSQRRRAREKVLIQLASSSFGGNYPGHISHTT